MMGSDDHLVKEGGPVVDLMDIACTDPHVANILQYRPWLADVDPFVLGHIGYLVYNPEIGAPSEKFDPNDIHGSMGNLSQRAVRELMAILDKELPWSLPTVP